MANISRSPAKSPDYAAHRLGVKAIDTIANVKKEHGMNMSGHEIANVQVLVGAGLTPTVGVYFWSEAAGKFVADIDTAAKVAPAAATPFEFTARANGRIMFVAVTAGAGATGVDVYVSGYGFGITE